MKKTPVAWVRRAQRVIRMVSELHRMGYQGLRIMPYGYPLGWRLAIAPRATFSALHGAVMESELSASPTYSGAGDGNLYFNWRDAQTDTAYGLARKFVERFEQTVIRGQGRDWAYAGWLLELVGRIEGENLLPLVLWEDQEEDATSLRYVPLWSFDETGTRSTDAGRFPLPPAPV